MKKLTVGILAHVDAGKTTLSEALLYLSGQTRKLGRVDHQDTVLDTDEQERERGITIFSKQARLTWGPLELTLLDTPGHVDFSAEMERTLQVLDYAVLVVSGADGVQGHTATLWRLLEHQNIPTFLFVNKMDQPDTDREALLGQLRRLDEGCTDFGGDREELLESAALCDENLLERYLAGEKPDDGDLAGLIVRRKLFPCLFGSALKLEGVEELLSALERYTLAPQWGENFAARVFKISRDDRGERLSWLKVTGGELRVRQDPVRRRRRGLLGGKDQPDPPVFRGEIYYSRSGGGRDGVRRHRPEPYPPGPGLGRRGGERPARAGAGAPLSGHPPGGMRRTHPAAGPAPAGRGGPPAEGAVERDSGGTARPAHGGNPALGAHPAHP